jgi:predicted secreted hydrolase
MAGARRSGARIAGAILGGWMLTVAFVAAADAPPLALTTSDGFAVPQPGRSFEFPRDHGSHPEFKIEWWYVTGHLESAERRRFGFQATFFRRAAPRAEDVAARDPDLLPGQVYLAHMALLEVRSGRFLHQERLNREGWEADAALGELAVRNGPWSLVMTDPETEVMRLRGSIRSEATFELELVPRKPLVVFGADGVSRKGRSDTAASYYLTFSRLAVTGRLEWGTETLAVTGQAWMDHEISSSQLAEDQAGWDWASLQLDDGREVMAYRLRLKDGGTDPFSTLAWVDRDGAVRHYTAREFSWTTTGTWSSPRSGAVYPLPVVLVCEDPETGEKTSFRLEPLALDQELDGAVGGIAYWEGACRVLNSQGQPIGVGFVELAGYAGDLAARFQ